MELSAETRWFWRGAGPPELRQWFMDASLHTCAPGGGRLRVDAYLSDRGQVELGIKRRGHRKGVEVKGLVAVLAGECDDRPFVGPVEIWAKWSSEALSLTGMDRIVVRKRRWLRKFGPLGSDYQEIALGADESPIDGRSLPSEGCNVEYTEISLDGGRVWTTLGFEAFGSLDKIAASLLRTTEHLSMRRSPTLVGAWHASYPRWLQQVAAAADA